MAKRKFPDNRVSPLLETLTPRERDVLAHLWGLGVDKPFTYGEIAKNMNTSVEEIKNIEVVALRKMRHPSRMRVLTEMEFEYYLKELLNKNTSFRNIQSETSFSKPAKYIADIIGEYKQDNKWNKFIIEIKNQSTFTDERILSMINQLKVYKKHVKDANLIVSFPGLLPDKYYSLFHKNNIEVWDYNFIKEHFKKEIEKTPHPLIHAFFSYAVSAQSEEERLISELTLTRPGRSDWFKYQTLMLKILETLVCPPLTPPITELSDEFKVNRRDYIIPNYAEDGFWKHLRERYTADFIVIDAKNYSKKVGKKDILQIANYLKEHGAGLFGIIISRNGGDRGSYLTAREIWATDKKLIIILDDEDIIKMLTAKSAGKSPEDLIRQKIEEFRLKI